MPPLSIQQLDALLAELETVPEMGAAAQRFQAGYAQFTQQMSQTWACQALRAEFPQWAAPPGLAAQVAARLVVALPQRRAAAGMPEDAPEDMALEGTPTVLSSVQCVSIS